MIYLNIKLRKWKKIPFGTSCAQCRVGVDVHYPDACKKMCYKDSIQHFWGSVCRLSAVVKEIKSHKQASLTKSVTQKGQV